MTFITHLNGLCYTFQLRNNYKHMQIVNMIAVLISLLTISLPLSPYYVTVRLCTRCDRKIAIIFKFRELLIIAFAQLFSVVSVHMSVVCIC